jgi:predicted nucleic acid-binding protein
MPRVANAYVVDSSVVIRWYVDQVGHEHARRVQVDFLAGRVRLEAPDICRWEISNILRKKAAGSLTADDIVSAAMDIEALGVVLHPAGLADLSRIVRLSISYGITVFDAAFVDVSLRTGLTLLTSDDRLVRAVAPRPVSTELLEGVY